MIPRVFSFALLISLVSTTQAGVILDLTTLDSSGTINGGRFSQFTEGGAGSGSIDAFVGWNNAQGAVTSGYNTAPNGNLEFDTQPGANTHPINVTDAALVNIGGINYREFALDINERATDAATQLLSVQLIEISIAASGQLTSYTPGGALGSSPFGAGTSKLVYSLDIGNDGDSRIDLNQQLSGPGQGALDMLMFIPDSLFTNEFGADPNVYVYTESGAAGAGPGNATIGWTNDANPEEWAVAANPDDPISSPTVPEPTSALVFAGLLGLGACCSRRRTRAKG